MFANNPFPSSRNAPRFAFLWVTEQIFGRTGDRQIKLKSGVKIVFGDIADNSRKLTFRAGRPDQFHYSCRAA
jgi:hypothetical protein